MGYWLRAGAVGAAGLPTLAQWIIAFAPIPRNPAFAYAPPTSAGTDAAIDQLSKDLTVWYFVILVAIPVVIALIPLGFPRRTVVLITAFPLGAGGAYSFVLGQRFIDWGFSIDWGLYSTYGPGLVAYAACYALSAVLLLVAGSTSKERSVRDAA